MDFLLPEPKIVLKKVKDIKLKKNKFSDKNVKYLDDLFDIKFFDDYFSKKELKKEN